LPATFADLTKFRILIFGLCALAFGTMAALRISGFHAAYNAIFYVWCVVVDFPWYRPFIDTHVVLAAIQCHGDGYDVFEYNPCDLVGRWHLYSPVWLWASPLGLTTADVPWVGTTLGLGFLAVSAAISNAVTLKEAAIYLLALFSQGIALALDRGNFDLLIFIMVVLACRVFARGPAGRFLAYIAIYLSAILKFYPVVAFMLALTEKKTQLIAIAILAGLPWLGFLYFEWGDLCRLLPHIPHAQPLQDAWGGLNFFQALAHLAIRFLPQQAHLLTIAGNLLYVIATLAAAVLSLFLARRLVQDGLRLAVISKAGLYYLAGASITLFAFFSTQNPPYRAMWFLLLLPLLLELRRDPAQRRLRPWLNGGIVLLVVLLWFEFIHIWVGRITGSPAAEDLLAFLVREPLWWSFITGVMTLLWAQLAQTPAFGRLVLYRAHPAGHANCA
jgi:hypothetical protein